MGDLGDALGTLWGTLQTLWTLWGQTRRFGVRPGSVAHNAVGLAGESPVVEIDCLST